MPYKYHQVKSAEELTNDFYENDSGYYNLNEAFSDYMGAEITEWEKEQKKSVNYNKDVAAGKSLAEKYVKKYKRMHKGSQGLSDDIEKAFDAITNAGINIGNELMKGQDKSTKSEIYYSVIKERMLAFANAIENGNLTPDMIAEYGGIVWDLTHGIDSVKLQKFVKEEKVPGPLTEVRQKALNDAKDRNMSDDYIRARQTELDISYERKKVYEDITPDKLPKEFHDVINGIFETFGKPTYALTTDIGNDLKMFDELEAESARPEKLTALENRERNHVVNPQITDKLLAYEARKREFDKQNGFVRFFNFVERYRIYKMKKDLLDIRKEGISQAELTIRKKGVGIEPKDFIECCKPENAKLDLRTYKLLTQTAKDRDALKYDEKAQQALDEYIERFNKALDEGKIQEHGNYHEMIGDNNLQIQNNNNNRNNNNRVPVGEAIENFNDEVDLQPRENVNNQPVMGDNQPVGEIDPLNK